MAFAVCLPLVVSALLVSGDTSLGRKYQSEVLAPSPSAEEKQLLAAVSDEKLPYEVRIKAVRKIAALRKTGTAVTLARLLYGRADELSFEILNALGSIGDRRVLPVLRDWEQDARRQGVELPGQVRVALKHAIKRLEAPAPGGTDRRLGSVILTQRPKTILGGKSGPVLAIAFLPKKHELISACSDGAVHVWNTQTGRKVTTLVKASGEWPEVYKTECMTFTCNGTLLASGRTDGTVQFLDTTKGRLVNTWTAVDVRQNAGFIGPTDWVFSVAFSRDGNLLAAGHAEGIKLWDVVKRREKAELTVQDSSVWSLAFGGDGTLASGHDDGQVTIWDLGKRRKRYTLKAHDSHVCSLAFSGNGQLLASGGSDKAVRLWDVRSGRELRTLKGHADEVRSVAFSPDDKLLASGSQDGTARLWNVATGKERAVLKGGSESVWCVTFSRDGSLLAVGSRDGTVRLWDVPAASKPEK
jgi:WD40 repeat protein